MDNYIEKVKQGNYIVLSQTDDRARHGLILKVYDIDEKVVKEIFISLEYLKYINM